MSSNRLEDQFISYEIALELKNLGFNESCLAVYVPYYMFQPKKVDLKVIGDRKNSKNSDLSETTTCPLYQQVFDYFETEHKLFSSIRIGLGSPIWYDYMIQSIDGRIIQISKKTFLDRELEEIMDEYEESSVYVEEDESFETKREAQIACINKLIEIVKEEKNEIV